MDVLFGKYWYSELMFMLVCLVMCVIVKCCVFLFVKI